MDLDRKYIAMGVMLSLSKHGEAGLSAHTLRRAQGDNTLLDREQRGVILRHPKYGEGGFFTLIVLVCLLLSANVYAQSDNKSVHQSGDNGVRYILDGVVSKYKLSGVNPNDILMINVEKKKANDSTYVNTTDKGSVIVVTKKYAIGQYQKKISSFSKDYKSYLSMHQNKDDICEYEINGTALEDNYYGNAQKLYKIPTESIKRVDFLKNPKRNGFPDKTNIVNILTKQ